MSKLETRRTYDPQPTGGKYVVNEYNNSRLLGTAGVVANRLTVKNQSDAEVAAGSLGNAYYDGMMDAHVGLTLNLTNEVTFNDGLKRRKGTRVLVTRRSGGLFKVVEVFDHVIGSVVLAEATVSLSDIRETGEPG